MWRFFVFFFQKDPQKVDLFQDTENLKDAQEYGKNTKFDLDSFPLAGYRV